MFKGKNKIKIMLDSSQAALFAAIEMHNKPRIEYRYPTAILLTINAWELLLKAFVYKYIGRQKIYEKDKIHTISFSQALDITRIKINTDSQNSEFEAVCRNLFLLEEYRNEIVHFGNLDLDAIVFMLLSKAVVNYNTFIKKYFEKDITRDDNLIILPIGFKLPIDPVEYLQKRATPQTNPFVKEVIDSIQNLKTLGITETIVVGFDFCMMSVKKIQNADIVAAIDSVNPDVHAIKEYRITDDPQAPSIRIAQPLLPLRYEDIQAKVKLLYPDIKFNKIFHRVMAEIKKDKTLCQTRYLDPDNTKSSKKDFYAEEAVPAIIKRYNEELDQ